MEYFLLAILIIVGYPALAHALLSRGDRRRIALLETRLEMTETEVQLLRKDVRILRNGQSGPAAPEPREIEHAVPEAAVWVPPAPPVAAPAPVVSAPPPEIVAAPPIAPAPEPVAEQAREPADVPEAEPVFAAQGEPAPAAPPVDHTPAWLLAARNWMFSGNLVAKMGLLILFIGVSFLLKYVAERVVVPIELRLAGIVLADIGLLAWGWRIRASRRGVGLPVQGAALGILMLVTFGAFRIYHLIPSGLAFGLLFVLTMFTCLLAMLQNAFWLAVFGITGGFAAPVLTSTGHGSHIGLFSYYGLLNAGILAIALRRTWRTLNLIGFAFTFVIGTAWGVLKYSPDTDYLSTQLFLLLFFAFYVAIALIYAVRQQATLNNYVDATLVFGTPLIAFGLQLGLMQGKAFGNAYSALGFGLFYTALALALWRRRGSHLRLLVESFLALGVVFGTLAIPFALDGRWTSAAWALEGAAVAWIGLRQKQKLAWAFGLLLQLGAAISFLGNVADMDTELAKASHLWLGFLVLGGAAMLIAFLFRRQAGDGEASATPTLVANGLLALAALWLGAAAWVEIGMRTHGTVQADLLVTSALGLALLFAFIAQRAQWKMARGLAMLVQLLAGATMLLIISFTWNWNAVPATLFERPLIGALMLAAGAFATSWNMQRTQPGEQLALRHFLLMWGVFWWFGPVLDILSGWLVHDLVKGLPFQPEHGAVYWMGFALSALATVWISARLRWPELRWVCALAWPALLAASLMVLAPLYRDDTLPVPLAAAAYLVLWAASEYLLKAWPARDWHIAPAFLKAIHLLRTVGPWLALWRAGELAIAGWLAGSTAERSLLAEGGWQVSGSWSHYVPAWALMLSLGWLIRRSSTDRWPVAPLADWYRRFVVPAATLFALLVVAAWNLRQDGTMAPLPYLPLLNPLDLSTAFVLLLAIACYRMMQQHEATAAAGKALPPGLGLACFAWGNLILLRTAAHYLDIAYAADSLFASQFVQAMLSLVWSVTAMVLMRRAASRQLRRNWVVGAILLGAVVAKLFLVDLSGTGSMERIVSFVGVGLLMVLIGYLAPFPGQVATETTMEGQANAS